MLGKEAGRNGSKRISQNHSDYRSARILRRVLET